MLCRSASQELPHFLLTESESLKVQGDLPPHSKYETSKLPLSDLTDQSAAQQPRLKQNGHAISQRAQVTKRQQQHAKQAQHGAALPADLAQQQSADLHLLGVHHQSQQVHARGQNGAAPMSPSMAHQAGNQSVHQARAGLQGTQFTAQQGQQMYSPSHVVQQTPTCQGVMGQASQQQAHEPHVAHQGQGASTANGYAIMAQQQQQQQLQHQQLQHQQQQYPPVMPLDGYSYFAQQSMPWQNAAAAAPYQTNGYSPTAFHGGPFRLPVSKQKVSMNALAHMPYHT